MNSNSCWERLRGNATVHAKSSAKLLVNCLFSYFMVVRCLVIIVKSEKTCRTSREAYESNYYFASFKAKYAGGGGVSSSGELRYMFAIRGALSKKLTAKNLELLLIHKNTIKTRNEGGQL